MLQRSTPLLNWLAGLAAASQEHVLLYERCAYSPIPIWLDGRRINDAGRPEDEGLRAGMGKREPMQRSESS